MLRAASTGIKLRSQLHFCQNHRTAKETGMHKHIQACLSSSTLTLDRLMNHVAQSGPWDTDNFLLAPLEPAPTLMGEVLATKPMVSDSRNGQPKSRHSPVWSPAELLRRCVLVGPVLACYPRAGMLQTKGTPGADVHTWDSQSPGDIRAEGTAGIRAA